MAISRTAAPAGLPHHRLDGPADGAPLVLGPSLGTSLELWAPQLPALTRAHRVLRWDLPGHGGSPSSLLPHDGSADVGMLAEQVLRLADAQGWERFAYAGVSLGGAVGLWLAVRHPERVTAVAAVCSSARFGDPDTWRERAASVRTSGTEVMVASRPGVWFAPGFEETARGAALTADLRATDDAGYAACCDALTSYDLRDQLASCRTPVLAVAGREDPATPPAHAREIADVVPGAALVEIPGAAHLANAERPEAVTAALLTHFSGSTDGTGSSGSADCAGSSGDGARHAAGMTVRRAVLGDAHVDRAVARTTPFTARFQDFITRYAWGEIWTGDALDRRQRSCITLTALVAHGHHAELAMHVRAALTNGLTRTQIGDVILQTAVYCGVPAANTAFGIAQQVFDELDTENGTD